MNGWQQSLQNKMHNYCAKLKCHNVSCPETEINFLTKKHPSDRVHAKDVKKMKKKAEVNDLPPHPVGESAESLEKERLDAIAIHGQELKIAR